MKKLLIIAVLGLILTSCSKGFDIVPPDITTTPETPQPPRKAPNAFNFSTIQNVKLNVDYSAFNTYGPVFFGVYTQNPIIKVEDAPEDKWNEAVTPVFEDLWPNVGDYDLNDALVNVKHEKEFNDKGKIVKETFYLTTYQNYVELTSGLALTLETKTTPESIAMKKMAKGSTVASEASFAKDGNVYYLTADFKGELGTTYILELSYKNALGSSADMATIKPFIYRSEGDKNWEVHIPMEAPTAKMNYNYFGTEDDCSDPSQGLYFVREGNYPFAFYLAGANISVFENTILKRENEKKRIDVLFPGFLEWSTSNGTKNQDWYLKIE